MAPKAERIRALNDALRQTLQGGKVVMTRRVAALSSETLAKALTALREFNAFTPRNDPHHEHDFASFEVEGHRFIFKIDYYDKTMLYGSPDPTDPELTTRVLTFMLEEDY